ncbi:MAG: SIR2 family protein [Rhodospirillales bacterium]
MADLRQVLSKGSKRIGILVGAGAPAAVRVDKSGNIVSEGGEALIPDVAGLTDAVVEELEKNEGDKEIIAKIKNQIGEKPNIEDILTRVRKLAQAIGEEKIHDLNGPGYEILGQKICTEIGKLVNRPLPNEPNAYDELVSWISGTHRDHAVEIFTPNYDLLIEQAFERGRASYFDGFTGAHKPFFDATSISSSDELPAHWSRVWKLHGSLGWKKDGGTIIRSGETTETELIYPDHLKYDETTRLPYSALFERLRTFLTTPDSLLITTGFSFFDSHISSVLNEALAANANTAVYAFQYKKLCEENLATEIARKRSNLSVYARDGAVINRICGNWSPGDPPDGWKEIRHTFWKSPADGQPEEFVLGDFDTLARFFAWAGAQQISENPHSISEKEMSENDSTQP